MHEPEQDQRIFDSSRRSSAFIRSIVGSPAAMIASHTSASRHLVPFHDEPRRRSTPEQLLKRLVSRFGEQELREIATIVDTPPPGLRRL